MKGNKGEWSEIYTLFKILSEKKLYRGDENLEKIPGAVFPLLNVLRAELSGDFDYEVDANVIIINTESENEKLTIPINDFRQHADLLLSVLKSNKSGAFAVPETEAFMRNINCSTLKASSSAKTDITVIVHDSRTNQPQELGFSIKSQLGSASTLLNAGLSTNFFYEIKGLNFSDDLVEKINAVEGRSKIKSRVERIFGLGGELEFSHTENKVFFNNLTLIDSRLPDILSELVLFYYKGKGSRTSDLLDKINSSNPLGYDMGNEHPFYEYKLRKFLTDTALGMMPSSVWSGDYDATGGYLIVKDTGDVLCYHIYNRNEFEGYLINNTKLETASSSRHRFGSILFEPLDGKYYLKLNLQIRFIK